MKLRERLEKAEDLLHTILMEVEDKCAETGSKFIYWPPKGWDLFDYAEICGKCIGCKIFNFLRREL